MNKLRIKILVGLVAGLILVGIGYNCIYADENPNLDISVSPGTWDILSQQGAGAVESETYTVTNGSNYYETVKIKLSDDGTNWDAGSAPGTDVYKLEFSLDTINWQPEALTTSEQMYKEYHSHEASTPLKLKFTPPTSTTYISDTVTVTLTAEGISGYTYNSAGDFYYKCIGWGEYMQDDWSGDYDSVIELISIESVSLVCTLSHLSQSDTSSSTMPGKTHYWTNISSYITEYVWAYPYATQWSQQSVSCPGGHSCYNKTTSGRCGIISNMSTTSMMVMSSEYQDQCDSCSNFIGTITHYIRPQYVVLD